MEQAHPDSQVVRDPTALLDGDANGQTEDKVVTLYAVNGLHEEPTNWLGAVLPHFSEETGIAVRYFEEHSRAIVRQLGDSTTPRADVLITLSPFIQMAAAQGLLASHEPEDAVHLKRVHPEGLFWLLMSNYPSLVCRKPWGEGLAYTDLLEPEFRGKIQYSKPGWSGAGTAFLLQVFQAFGGKAQGLEFLRKLQPNCLPPAAHTQGLVEMIEDGSLLVVNGDVQTNLPQCRQNRNIEIAVPIAPDGRKYVYEFSYYVALVRDAPNPEHAKALIDFLLSEEAQASTSPIAYGLPARSDIRPTDDAFRKIEGLLESVEIWEPDWARVIETLDHDVAEYDRIVLGY